MLWGQWVKVGIPRVLAMKCTAWPSVWLIANFYLIFDFLGLIHLFPASFAVDEGWLPLFLAIHRKHYIINQHSLCITHVHDVRTYLTGNITKKWTFPLIKKVNSNVYFLSYFTQATFFTWVIGDNRNKAKFGGKSPTGRKPRKVKNKKTKRIINAIK